MIKHAKSKVLFAIFVDFLFILIFVCVVSGTVYVLKYVLYPEEDAPKSLLIRTEYMPNGYRYALSVGDEVYDTLTKRKVGQITDAEITEMNGEICFYITIDARFTPRSRALRTRDLWFYFASEDK